MTYQNQSPLPILLNFKLVFSMRIKYLDKFDVHIGVKYFHPK